MFRPGTSLSTTETVAGFKPKCWASFFKLVGLLDAPIAFVVVAAASESPATVVETCGFSPLGMLAQMRTVYQKAHHCKVVTESSSNGRSSTKFPDITGTLCFAPLLVTTRT